MAWELKHKIFKCIDCFIQVIEAFSRVVLYMKV